MTNPNATTAETTTNRRLRTAALIASTGLIATSATAIASPAFAATADDCTDANTVSAADGDDRDDLQSLLADDGVSLICISGTIPITSKLERSAEAVTLFGLNGGTLDGGSASSIIMAGALTVHNLTFSNGRAASYQGGAIDADTLTVIDSTFTGNSALIGGAISANTLTVSGSTFTNNTATDSFIGGGAILADTVTVTNSTFSGNTGFDGGAIFSYGAVIASASTFVDNSAENYGGAIRATISTVRNATFVDNVAGDEGGAIFAGDSLVEFSTFLDNAAATPVPEGELPGEAIYLETVDGETLTVRGNIFAGSRGYPQLGIGGILQPDLIVDRGGNVFSTTADVETDLTTPHPSTQFGTTPAQVFGAGAALASNGGPTQTLALVAGSPAIDAVPPLDSAVAPALMADVEVDQRGLERVGMLDAGAYEFIPETPELADTGADTSVTGWLAGIAAVLLGIGATLTVVMRRSARR